MMTDGERHVWAASYALALSRSGDSVAATQAASNAVLQLREAASLRSSDGGFMISQRDEREFIDEMVTAP